jgi:hypothetical protein
LGHPYPMHGFTGGGLLTVEGLLGLGQP